MELDLREIQGNVMPGFNKDYQAFVFVQFPSGDTARAWLKELTPEIATSNEVAAFNTLFKEIRERRRSANRLESPDFGALSVIRATWTNIALTRSGLQCLGVDFPDEPLRIAIEGLRPPAKAETAHALLLVAADSSDDLDQELTRHIRRLSETYRATVWPERGERGESRKGALSGHEHFGFKDGISQPRIAGTDFGTGNAVAPGEFIIGYPVEPGSVPPPDLPDWSPNGSFLVFLKLRQAVESFDKDLDRFAEVQLTSADQLGAAIVGRWKSGAPAGQHLAAIRHTETDPGLDSQAIPTPKSAYSHIGRANPDKREATHVNRHRIIRRGIPFTHTTNNSNHKGLLFLAYQADIHDQFEHVWQRWLNSTDFPQSGSGTDPLVGQSAGRPVDERSVTLDSRSTEKVGRPPTIRLNQFVTPEYVQYLFSPSIGALSTLARDQQGDGSMTTPASKTAEETISDFLKLARTDPAALANYFQQHPKDTHHMVNATYGAAHETAASAPTAANAEQVKAELDGLIGTFKGTLSTDLASYIADEYPYPLYPRSLQIDPLASEPELGGPAKESKGDFAKALAAFTEVQRGQILHWELNGVVSNITKGIRLPFTYQLPNGELRHGQILIGYAGPPW